MSVRRKPQRMWPRPGRGARRVAAPPSAEAGAQADVTFADAEQTQPAPLRRRPLRPEQEQASTAALELRAKLEDATRTQVAVLQKRTAPHCGRWARAPSQTKIGRKTSGPEPQASTNKSSSWKKAGRRPEGRAFASGSGAKGRGEQAPTAACMGLGRPTAGPGESPVTRANSYALEGRDEAGHRASCSYADGVESATRGADEKADTTDGSPPGTPRAAQASEPWAPISERHPEGPPPLWGRPRPPPRSTSDTAAEAEPPQGSQHGPSATAGARRPALGMSAGGQGP